MNRLLLILATSLAAAHAQSEIAVSSAFAGGEGVNGEVNAVVVQTDGKIVIGGRFTAVNGIPRNNIARLNAEVARLLQTPDVKKIFAHEGADAVGNSPEAFAVVVKAEFEKWAKVIKTAGIKID